MIAKRFRNGGVRSITAWGVCALVGALGAIKPVSAEPALLYARMQPVAVDSGRLDNPRNEPAVVFSQVIDLGPDAPWVRVLFDKETTLAPGSYIRVTSLVDAETQILDAEQLRNWNYGTAFFNGSQVTIELIAAGGASGNALKVSQVFVGEIPPSVDTGGVAAICGNDDNRAPFQFPYDSQSMGIGRLLNTVVQPEGENTVPLKGCTAFIVGRPSGTENPDKLHLTAGHCFDHLDLGREWNQNLTDPYVLQFNVYCYAGTESTCSNTNCTIKHPAVVHQFPVRGETVISQNDGAGNDWAVFRCGRNSVGKTTWEHQTTPTPPYTRWAFPLADPVPGVGTDVRVTGYGVDGNEGALGGGNAACICNTSTTGRRNVTLQTAPGPAPPQPPSVEAKLRGVSGTVIAYDADMCGANSGSPVFNRDTGEVIGINTHHGCASTTPETGLNYGTAITHTDLQPAIVFLENTAIPAASTWGLIVMTLIGLVLGTIMYGRRRVARA